MVAVCVIIKVDGLMVGGMGLEPIRQKACDFKSQTATNYVTRPLLIHLPIPPPRAKAIFKDPPEVLPPGEFLISLLSRDH